MKKIYVGLFAVLYLAVAAVSTIHAIEFFGLANNSWMSVILAISFELGQAAVLFSLLTSGKERGKVMPWVLMGIFTLVQVLGNVYSSYKHIITSSSESLRFFKEPIFIWTNLPDDQATVIVTYIVGAILPICALLLTSMVTNQLEVEPQKNQEMSDKVDKNHSNELNDTNINNQLENKESSLDVKETIKNDIQQENQYIEEEQKEQIEEIDKKLEESINEDVEEVFNGNIKLDNVSNYNNKSHFINLK